MSEMVGVTLGLPVYSFESPGSKPFIDMLNLKIQNSINIYKSMPNSINLA
jgi:putative lipase involved disintegration of autophagic bodies